MNANALTPPCGNAEPHEAHDTGWYEPGKPRHHGFSPIRCPGVAAASPCGKMRTLKTSAGGDVE